MVTIQVSINSGSLRLVHTIKTKLIKCQTIISTDMLNFDFLEKGLGLVSPPLFVYHFLGKVFLMLCSIIAKQLY